VLDRPVAEPPKDAGAGQGEEPLGGGDPLDDDLGDDSGEDDGDGGPGGGTEKVAENGHQIGISFVLFLLHFPP